MPHGGVKAEEGDWIGAKSSVLVFFEDVFESDVSIGAVDGSTGADEGECGSGDAAFDLRGRNETSENILEVFAPGAKGMDRSEVNACAKDEKANSGQLPFLS